MSAISLVLPESYCVNVSGLALGKYSCDNSDGQVCKNTDSASFDGLESFDDTTGAAIVVVLAMLQQKYDHVFVATSDTVGDLAGLYFFFITVVGVFFLLNYTLATISYSYSLTRHRGDLTTGILDMDNSHHKTHTNESECGNARQGGTEVGPRKVPGATRENVDPDIVDSVNDLDQQRKVHVSWHAEGESSSEKGEPGRMIPERRTIPADDTPRLRHILRGATSTRQVFERFFLAVKRVKNRSSSCDYRPWLRPFAEVIAYPNAVGSQADLCNKTFTRTPYSEVLVRIAIIVHVSILASVTTENFAIIRNADAIFVFLFAGIEVCRVCAYAGIWRYLNASWRHRIDLIVTTLTVSIWLAGVSQRIQLAPLRILQLTLSVFDSWYFVRMKHVLWMIWGKNGELPIAAGAVLLSYVICAFIIRQVFRTVMLKDEGDMFNTWSSCFISMMEMTSGDALQVVMLAGYRDLGQHAVVIAIAICSIVKHVINKIFVPVILENLAAPDPDKITFQLQFERLAFLHGWDDDEQRYHWRHTQDHSELLSYGEKQILIPDIAGSFERISVDPNVHRRWQQAPPAHGRQDEDGRKRFEMKRLYVRMIDNGKAFLQNLNERMHRAMHMDANYVLKVRVVKCSTFPVRGKDFQCKLCRVRIESFHRHPHTEEMAVQTTLSGLPDIQVDMRWEEEFCFGPLSREGHLKLSIVDNACTEGIEVLCGHITIQVSSLISEKGKVLLTSHLFDAQGNLYGITEEGCWEEKEMKFITIQVKSELQTSSDSWPARVRLQIKSVVNNEKFDIIVFSMIILNIGTAIAQYELEESLHFNNACDAIFTTFFTIEAVIKIAGFGVWYEPDAYFRSKWNIFDFFVVTWTLAFALAGDQNSLNTFALRALRIWPLLKRQPRFQAFQISVRALLRSMPFVLCILFTQLAFIFTSSVICLWAFRGRIFRCTDDAALRHYDCHGTFRAANGFLLPRVYHIPHNSFDTLAAAINSCYRSLNRSGWQSVVENAMHAMDENSIPPENRSEENALPFMILDFVCNSILFQASTAIMIHAIGVTSGRVLLTAHQKAHATCVGLILKAQKDFVKHKQNEGIEWLQNLVKHRNFERLTTLVILTNIMVLLVESYNTPEWQRKVLQVLNQLFVYYYAAEQVVKVAAFSWAHFFPKINGKRRVSFSHLFDFLVSLVSLIEVFSNALSALSLLRCFRALRLLNLLPPIRRVVLLASNCLPSFVACMFLFMVFVVSFSVMGTPIFHDVKRGFALTRHTNMDTVKEAVVVLVRAAGGEDWPAMMYELSVQEPYCTFPDNQTHAAQLSEKSLRPGAYRGDCGTILAFPFFYVFAFFCRFAFIPLFSASMISTFLHELGQVVPVNSHDIALFTKIWGQLDSKSSGTLSLWKLRCLVGRLDSAGSILGFDVTGMPDRLEKIRLALIEMKKQDSSTCFLAEHCNKNVAKAAKVAATRLQKEQALSGSEEMASPEELAHMPHQSRKEKLESKMIMTFQEVFIALVSMKFFEMAVVVPMPDEQYADFVMKWVHEVNNRTLSEKLFREVGSDMLLQGFRFHVWFHGCFVSEEIRGLPLFVRVIIKKPDAKAVIFNTRTVSATICYDSTIKQSETHTWREHLTLDFNGSEDTTITFEILATVHDDKEAVIGYCTERLCDLTFEPLATRTMEILTTPKDMPLQRIDFLPKSNRKHNKSNYIGHLNMMYCWKGGYGNKRKKQLLLSDIPRADYQSTGDAFPCDVSLCHDDKDEASSCKSSLSALALHGESYGMAKTKNIMQILAQNAVLMLGSKRKEEDLERRNIVRREYLDALDNDNELERQRLRQRQTKSAMLKRVESERLRKARQILSTDRTPQRPALVIAAQAKWREQQKQLKEKQEVTLENVTLQGLFTPLSVGRGNVREAETEDKTPSHWLNKSRPPRRSNWYSNDNNTWYSQDNTSANPKSIKKASSNGKDGTGGLQMLEAQARYGQQQEVGQARYWLGHVDEEHSTNEVQWWLASSENGGAGFGAEEVEVDEETSEDFDEEEDEEEHAAKLFDADKLNGDAAKVNGHSKSEADSGIHDGVSQEKPLPNGKMPFLKAAALPPMQCEI
jgi:hypothetical protein